MAGAQYVSDEELLNCPEFQELVNGIEDLDLLQEMKDEYAKSMRKATTAASAAAPEDNQMTAKQAAEYINIGKSFELNASVLTPDRRALIQAYVEKALKKLGLTSKDKGNGPVKRVQSQMTFVAGRLASNDVSLPEDFKREVGLSDDEREDILNNYDLTK